MMDVEEAGGGGQEVGTVQWGLVPLWSRKMGFSFNALAIGPLFDSDRANIIFGTVKGKIRIYVNDKEERVLDTRGGSVQDLQLHDVTRFGATTSLDLIVGDGDGHITIFSHHEILQRSSAAYAITTLAVTTDILNNFALIAGDSEGHLTAFRRDHEVVWKTQVGQGAIRATHAMLLNDEFGNVSSYLLVGNSSDSLLFYCQGVLVKRLHVGARINTICSGYFKRDESSDSSSLDQQIAVGCDNGWIYLVQNYRVQKLVQVGHCITKLLPFSGHATADAGAPTPLICCGHFNALKLYQDGQLLAEARTEDWVHTVAVGDVDADGVLEIVAGQLNDHVTCLKYTHVGAASARDH